MLPITLDLMPSQTKNPLYERLLELGLPDNKTEQYRRFAVKPLLEHPYMLQIPEKHTPGEGEALIIENGNVTQIPRGCSVTYVSAFEADTTHYDALYFLSHLLVSSVICLEIEAEGFFEIRHIVTQKNAALPYRLCVTLASGKRAEILETFDNEGSTESLLLYGIDATIRSHATLRWIREENGSHAQTAVIGTHRFDVKANGALELKTFDFGALQALHLYKIDLGEYAWCDAAHLLLASGEARRGNVVHINHERPYARCIQDARSILKDKATGIFDGLIRVGKSARHAIAHQNSKSVLIDRGAFMYGKPQLEIYTDELEAAHGATIGQLDEDALFYLRSRGISESEARKILILAFADVLIDGLGDGKLSKRIRADFEAAYFAEGG